MTTTMTTTPAWLTEAVEANDRRAEAKAPAPTPTPVCPTCSGLLGPLPPGAHMHPLCAWATPEDWRVIAAWFGGAGGNMGSE